jgi:hypothetical protein
MPGQGLTSGSYPLSLSAHQFERIRVSSSSDGASPDSGAVSKAPLLVKDRHILLAMAAATGFFTNGQFAWMTVSIPSDNVDSAMEQRPKRWQIGFIRSS